MNKTSGSEESEKMVGDKSINDKSATRKDDFNDNPSDVRKSRRKSPYERVLEKSRAEYKHERVRETRIKRQIIEEVIREVSREWETPITLNQFLEEYSRQVGLLLDTGLMWRECNRLHLDVYTIASNIPFYGRHYVKEALENGLDALKVFIPEWDEPLFPLIQNEAGVIGLAHFDKHDKYVYTVEAYRCKC